MEKYAAFIKKKLKRGNPVSLLYMRSYVFINYYLFRNVTCNSSVFDIKRIGGGV